MTDTPAQRRLILYMSMSLDGFAARRDRTMDWLSGTRAYASHRQRGVAELLGQAGELVLGAKAGQEMAQAWPGSHSPTGELMNELPKTLFSATLTEVAWENARVTDRPIEQEIPELKRQQGKDLVLFGGAGFARSLAAQGLIDEYRINVHPVTLGEGLPLLPDGLRLELVCSTAWADGTVSHTYIPA